MNTTTLPSTGMGAAAAASAFAGYTVLSLFFVALAIAMFVVATYLMRTER